MREKEIWEKKEKKKIIKSREISKRVKNVNKTQIRE